MQHGHEVRRPGNPGLGGLLLASYVALAAASVGCGGEDTGTDGGRLDGAADQGGDGALPDQGGQDADQGGGGPEFVGRAVLEQLSTGMPNVRISFVRADEATRAPQTERSGCQIGCFGTYPDDPGITCAEPSLTPVVQLDNGPVALDIDNQADGDFETALTYDFVGNAYASSTPAPNPFFETGAVLRITTTGGDEYDVPDALQATVTGPAPIELAQPATGDMLAAGPLAVRWAAGSGETQVVISMSAQFGGLVMGMPTGKVVRQMTVTCTVDDTGSFDVPADVTAVLQPGQSDFYFQCGGPGGDQCVSFQAARQSVQVAAEGSTELTVVGSAASPNVLLAVPVPMMEEMP
jgi:hypothetical protein